MAVSENVKKLVLETMRHDYERLQRKGPHVYSLPSTEAWRTSSTLKRACEREGNLMFEAMHLRALEACVRRIDNYEALGVISSGEIQT